jgi:flagellar biosynthesis protein FlhF
MQVKIFESTDMASGLKLVRKELGPDALILSTRTVRSGRLGILGKQILEITAAVDTTWPRQPHKNKPTEHSFQPPLEHLAYTSNSGVLPSTATVDDYEVKAGESLFKIGARPERPSQALEQPSLPAAENPQIRQEFDELKNMVKSLAGEITRLGRRSETDNGQARNAGLSGNSTLHQRLQSSGHTQVLDLLLSHGVNLETARTISGFAKDSLSEADLTNEQKLYGFLQNTIADILQVERPDFNRTEQQHRIALVGPTGVGKTTTLAKIAADYLSNYSNSIALITIDTYRIAAVEQLKVYGEIMHVPVDVVLTPLQLEQAITRHQDKELILIDTAGRSPRDTLSIDELATFLHPDLGVTKHLVLSATNREEELAETISRFAPLGIDRTIFTKVDECINLGIILNTQIHNSSPLSYITNGQRVPEDLFQADSRKIAELIMPSPEGRFHE